MPKTPKPENIPYGLANGRRVDSMHLFMRQCACYDERGKRLVYSDLAVRDCRKIHRDIGPDQLFIIVRPGAALKKLSGLPPDEPDISLIRETLDPVFMATIASYVINNKEMQVVDAKTTTSLRRNGMIFMPIAPDVLLMEIRSRMSASA